MTILLPNCARSAAQLKVYCDGWQARRRVCVLGLICSVLMTACSSSSTRTAPPTATASNEDWFCQLAAAEDPLSEDQWDCIQSDALARAPQPQRLPMPKVTQPEPLVAPPSPRRASVPQPPVEKRDAPPATPAQSPSGASSQPGDVPAHVALSYRPEKPVSLHDLPADFWAVQLIALSSKDAVEAFAKQNNIRGMSAARIAIGDTLYYVLLLGVYETRANAERAVTDLPPPFNVDKPWIRSLGSLQSAMRAGDTLAGTNSI